MRKLIFIPLVFVFNILIIGCQKNGELIQTSLLSKRWIESYEEKTSEEIEIYRAGDHEDFPPARYRQVFYFNDNNECEYSVLAANDAHYMAKGIWEYNDKTKIIKVYNSDSEMIYEFMVIELSNQILKLKASN